MDFCWALATVLVLALKSIYILPHSTGLIFDGAMMFLRYVRLRWFLVLYMGFRIGFCCRWGLSSLIPGLLAYLEMKGMLKSEVHDGMTPRLRDLYVFRCAPSRLAY